MLQADTGVWYIGGDIFHTPVVALSFFFSAQLQ
jgi:hypothetical protein